MLPIFPTISPAEEVALLHDARAIHDLATLRFDEYALGGKPSWVLATITPGPHSGAATVPGGYIEADTGKLVIPSGAQTSIIKEGAWKVLAAASPGPNHADGSYSWYEPMEAGRRILHPEDYYSPFAHSCSILFRPMPEKAGMEQFGATRLVFPDWIAGVAAAFAFYQANARLLDPGTQILPRPPLLQLVSQKNPLLASVAFRVLLSLGLVEPEYLRAQVVRRPGPLCAVFGYLAIVTSDPSTTHPWWLELGQSLDKASEPAARALVLGAFAAGLFRAHDSDHLARAKAVLGKARQRLRATGVPIDHDARLAWMFARMGS